VLAVVIGAGSAIAVGVLCWMLTYTIINGPQMRAATERQLAEERERENRAFCAKLGITPGTDAFVGCANDLTHVRRQHEQRLVQNLDIF
jgi:LmbE family N-acetylglucosaminyl deacetylase